MPYAKKLPVKAESDWYRDTPGFVVGPDVGKRAVLGEMIVEGGFDEEVDTLRETEGHAEASSYRPERL